MTKRQDARRSEAQWPRKQLEIVFEAFVAFAFIIFLFAMAFAVSALDWLH